MKIYQIKNSVETINFFAAFKSGKFKESAEFSIITMLNYNFKCYWVVFIRLQSATEITQKNGIYH